MQLDFKSCAQEKPPIDKPFLAKIQPLEDVVRYAVLEAFDEERYIQKGWEYCQDCGSRAFATCNPNNVNSYTVLILEWANLE